MLYVGIAASLLIGVLLGLLGGGGSILTVPLLVYVLKVEPRTAIAMSLLVVGVTSGFAAVVHARAGRVRWRTAFVFGAGGMVGAFLGGRLASYVPPAGLLLLFTGVMVAAAVAMLRRKEAAPDASSTPAPEVRAPVVRVLVQGVAVGLLSGLVGAGGGFLIVPALVLVGLPTVAAVGTSLVVISLQCLAGLAGHLGHVDLPWGLTGAVLTTAVAGSFIGGRLLTLLKPATVRKGFAWFVLGTATFMALAQVPPSVREQAQPLLARAGFWVWWVGAAVVGLPLFFFLRMRRPSTDPR
jgi:hypothetical protein